MNPPRPTDERVELLRHLGDPIRLGVLDRLGAGPATVSELAARLDVTAPQLSNHLSRLRAAGLVDAEQDGRQRVYRAVSPGIATLLALLDDLVRDETSAGSRETDPPFVLARTCYDHLAGRLGVGLFDRLVALDAIRARGAHVEHGPSADKVFRRLGVLDARTQPTRRKFATACQDGTEGKPHLGGALGAAMATAMIDKGWIRTYDDQRAVDLTSAGRAGLRRAIQLTVDASGHR